MYKNSLIVYGYSQTLSLAIFHKLKIVKVKSFNVSTHDNVDLFFNEISTFLFSHFTFNSVYYSLGPGGFTIIRRLLSYIKALTFNKNISQKFIGFNNLFVLAYYLNNKIKIKEKDYILSILNHSNDNFMQLYQKKLKSSFSLHTLSEIKNINLNMIDTFLEKFDLNSNNVYLVYMNSHSNNLSIPIKYIVEESNMIEVIVKISQLIENTNLDISKYNSFFSNYPRPLYGKLPSTN
ncbi:MAG: hypothetical protein CBC14_001920 [Alphaproteobacteria bacterium TMED54]|nr:MAG: hypothetical protein CBC14_001920 [Alphaproteobacteria bacterium TMED54]